METFQDCFWRFVIFLTVYNGNIEAAASVFCQQVTVNAFFFFTVSFELHTMELGQLKRLYAALRCHFIVCGNSL